MPKITFIGAGSTVFAKNLLGDILSFPELADSTISLFDIDQERLDTTALVAHRLARLVGAHPKIETTKDRRSRPGWGGLRGVHVPDRRLQTRHGDRFRNPQEIRPAPDHRRHPGHRRDHARPAHHSGAAGYLQGYGRAVPGVTFLNYVNPMAMNCWAISRGSKIKTVGPVPQRAGHGRATGEDIGIPIEEINYLCAGINHMAFYLRFERKGKDGQVEDLYPRIHQVVKDGRVPDWNRVRYEMCERLGYFVTESSEHFSEYTPYFIKHDRPDLIERFNVPLDEYIRRCEVQIAGWGFMKREFENPGSVKEEEVTEVLLNAGVSPAVIEFLIREFKEETEKVTLSHEYGSLIIHSLETGQPRVIYGNMPNHGLIDNLPQDCVVEVPCLVDKNGIQPTHIGRIPPHLAALMQTNINVQSLAVEAAITRQERAYLSRSDARPSHGG